MKELWTVSKAISQEQTEYMNGVRRQREGAHAEAVRAALVRIDPDLTFGNADLGAGSQPLTWGTGMTRANQAAFTENVHRAFPDRLIECARDGGRPLRVRVTAGRAHYQARGSYERIPAEHFVSTRGLLEALDHPDVTAADTDTDAVRADRLRLRLRMRFVTRHPVRKGDVPSRYDNVLDTPENRERLQTVIDAWPSDTADRYFIKRMGKSPVLVAEDGRLYLRSKKNVGTLDGAPVSELTSERISYLKNIDSSSYL
jgi:hypothetical protein